MKTLFISIFASLILISINSFGATFTSNSAGDWNTPATWTVSGGSDADGIPDADDDVIIQHAITFNLGGNITINSLQFNAWMCSLTMTTSDASYVLTITNDIDVTWSGGSSTFTMGTDVNVTATNYTILPEHNITTGSGSDLTLSGTLDIGASSCDIDINGDISVANLAISNGDNTVINIDAASTVDITGELSIASGPNTIDVYGALNAATGDFSGGTNALNVYSGGEVNFSSDIAITGSAGLSIGNSGDLIVGGDVAMSGGSSLSVDGSMGVNGSMSMTNGIGTVNVDGALTVANTLDIGENTINGSGSISADPLVCASDCGTQISGPTVLPIELVYFKAIGNTNSVDLLWQTASEINNDFFTIERSANGIHFKELEYITGAGNSSTLIDYTFTDYYPLNGINYYRIKQTDYDGTYSYSTIVSAYLGSENSLVNNKLILKPNPYKSGDIFAEVYNTNSGEMLTVKLYAINGQLVKSINVLNNETSNINLKSLFKGSEKSGMYFIQIISSSFSQNVILNKK